MRLVGRHSALVKELARLKEPRGRRQQGRFLVEGLGTLQEALATGALQLLLVDREGSELALAALRAGVEVALAGEGVLDRLAPSQTSQGALGVASLRLAGVDEIRGADFLLFLEDVGDPGNVGTLLRTAWACGVDGVVLDGGADPFGPKVVRASAGAVFHLRLSRGAVAELAGGKHQFVAAVARGGEPMFGLDFDQRVVLMVGNEARGLSASATRAAQRLVTVPMWGGCESLNVAVSGSLLMYEYRRSSAPRPGGSGKAPL